MKTMIDEMVSRFLGWKLPANFAPDAGTKFVPGPLQQPGGPYWPSGTNLLDATQARQMFEHCVQIPAQLTNEEINESAEAAYDAVQGMADEIVTGTTFEQTFARNIEARILEKLGLKPSTLGD